MERPVAMEEILGVKILEENGFVKECRIDGKKIILIKTDYDQGKRIK